MPVASVLLCYNCAYCTCLLRHAVNNACQEIDELGQLNRLVKDLQTQYAHSVEESNLNLASYHRVKQDLEQQNIELHARLHEARLVAEKAEKVAVMI